MSDPFVGKLTYFRVYSGTLKAGDRDKAYALSRDAYLNHFEFVEIPLRLRNPNLVLDTEFKYAKLRNDIRDGESVGKIRSDTAVVRAALVEEKPSILSRWWSNTINLIC